MKDNGLRTNGLSPKAIAAVVAAIVGYLLTQTVLDLPAWAELAGQVALVGIAAFSARPGDVTVDPAERSSWGSERGQTEPLTLLVYVIVVIILLAVLFKVLHYL